MTERERAIRALVYNKFNGKCAYSGTELKYDWQVEHIIPHRGEDPALKADINNMCPVQKLINHYKHSMPLEDYRYTLKNMHKRLAKLPKKPRTVKSRRRIIYMTLIAEYFGITPDRPFDGVFYFEKLKKIRGKREIR